MTHNTANCKKYGKDGSLKKGFKKPSGQSDSKGNQNFAQVLKQGFAKMTKILKDKKLVGEGQTEETHSEKGGMSNWRGLIRRVFLDCGPWRGIDSRR